MEKLFYLLPIIFIIRELYQLLYCSSIEQKKVDLGRKLHSRQVKIIDILPVIVDMMYIIWLVWALFIPYARMYAIGIWICYIAMIVIKKKKPRDYAIDAILSILFLFAIIYNGYTTL